MVRIKLNNDEYYHIFNRGVDKRVVFQTKEDFDRFLVSVRMFNTKNPIGSIYEQSFKKQLGGPTAKLKEPLVELLCYCLNPNHYHLVLRQRMDGGISEFMKRLGCGYTWYFNNKYKRSGVLFQGKFKAVHVSSNEQLLHLSAYVNLNQEKHQLGGRTAKLGRSSWGEYMGELKNEGGENDFNMEICEKDIVLEQFNSKKEYKKFAENSLEDILARREHEELLFA